MTVKVDVAERTAVLSRQERSVVVPVPVHTVKVARVGPQGPPGSGGVGPDLHLPGTLAVDGDSNLSYFTSAYGGDLGGYRLTSVGAPVDPTDAATKAYVDANAGGGKGAPATPAGYGFLLIEEAAIPSGGLFGHRLPLLPGDNVLDGVTVHPDHSLSVDDGGWWTVTASFQTTTTGTGSMALCIGHDALVRAVAHPPPPSETFSALTATVLLDPTSRFWFRSRQTTGQPVLYTAWITLVRLPLPPQPQPEMLTEEAA
jgi:hypothetical protein